ncbi:MAG TPA: hypothetical protein VG937_30210 [Polyangiaceae bacterium]|nr:hypothetical protein [Polyangiaceae bacterium]
MTQSTQFKPGFSLAETSPGWWLAKGSGAYECVGVRASSRGEALAKHMATTGWVAGYVKPSAAEPAKAPAKPAKVYTDVELQVMIDQLRVEIEEEKRKLGVQSEARVSAAQTVHSDPRLAEIDSQLAGYKPVVINSAYKQTFTSCPQVAVKSPAGYDPRLKAKLDEMVDHQPNPHVTETSTKQVFHR